MRKFFWDNIASSDCSGTGCPGGNPPGVIEGIISDFPRQIGVRVMKDWIMLLIRLIEAVTALIDSIKK